MAQISKEEWIKRFGATQGIGTHRPGSLEQAQSTTNLSDVAQGNTSASLEPRQASIEVEALIDSANLLAAGQRMGLDNDTTLQMISQFSAQNRKQKNKGPVTQQEAIGRLRQAANSLSGLSEPEMPGTGYQQKMEVDPFGVSDEEFRAVMGQPIDDRYSDEPAKPRGIYGTRYRSDGSADYFIDEGRKEENPAARESVVPQSAVRETLRQLGDRDATLAGRIEDALEYGSVQRGAEQSLAREMVRQETSRQSQDAYRWNTLRAGVEASGIARDRFTTKGGGAIADEILNRLNPDGGFNVGTAAERDGVYVDTMTGQPIEVNEPSTDVFAGSNTPNTAQQQNAPQRDTSVDFVVAQQPEYRQQPRSFGDYDQVSIMRESTLMADRMKNLKSYPFADMQPQVLGADQLQAQADAVIQAGQARGDRFFNTKPGEGGGQRVRQFTDTPGVDAALNKLRYGDADRDRLARAVVASEGARRSGINQAAKDRFYSGQGPYYTTKSNIKFGAAEAMPSARPDETQAKVAFKSGFGPIGAVIDRSTGKMETDAGPGYMYRYNRTGKSGADIDVALERKAREASMTSGKPVDPKKLKQNITKAKLVEARADRDQTKRAEQMSTIISSLPPNARQVRIR